MQGELAIARGEDNARWLEQVAARVAEQLDLPLALVDAHLTLLWANSAARLRHGAIWSALFDATAAHRPAQLAVRGQLQDLVAACLRQRQDTEALVEAEDGSWFAAAALLHGHTGVVLLRASAMHQLAAGVRERLHRLFGLSRAEALIAVQLANGCSVESIAEARGVSVDTVRAQVRSVFHKTGVHRQGELICAVGRLAVS